MDGPRGAPGAAPVRDPPFELIFRLDDRDYQAFLRKLSWRLVERALAFFAALGFGAAGGLAGAFVSHALGNGEFDNGASLAAAIAGAVILYLFYRFVIMRLYYRSFFAGQPVALGETKVVADMRGIGSNVAEIVIAMPLACVIRIVETDQHFFLMFARLAGVIVPKRAFASADQAKRFAAFAWSMAPSARR